MIQHNLLNQTIKKVKIKHLHKANKQYATPNLRSLLYNTFNRFSTNPNSQFTNYNDFNTIRELYSLSTHQQNSFSSTSQKSFLFQHYQTVSLDLERKLEKIESILQSPEKNLYKIVEQMMIVLEAFAQVNRRDILEENVIKVIGEFGKKIVSAHLQNVQTQEVQLLERNHINKNTVEQEEQTDSSYKLHQDYIAIIPQLQQQKAELFQFQNTQINIKFIFFYIQSIKSWLLSKIQTDSLIRQAEKEMFKVFQVREVSALSDTLRNAVQNLVINYIEQPSERKRELFPFDIKLRAVCLLPFFENKKHVEMYLSRLAEENLVIYLKQSQLLNLMYDIVEIKPDLINTTDFVYQVQYTSIYQNLAFINGTYIKALFINYTRKFMVSYQQIQFYELFRDIEPKIKYPTIRTFIRLAQILNTEASDLHCEYNKLMNKYNYNIILSIIISENYSIQKTNIDEFIQLFQVINSVEKAGEILYEEMARFLRVYWNKQQQKLSDQKYQKVYKLLIHALNQFQPILKYENKETLNKEYGRKTIILICALFDILLQKFPHIIIIGSKFLKSYLISDLSISSSLAVLPFDDQQLKVQIDYSQDIQTKLDKIKSAYAKIVEQPKQLPIYGPSNKIPYTQTQFLEFINLSLKMSVHWIKKDDEGEKAPSSHKLPSEYKLIGNIYPIERSVSLQQSLFNNILQPFMKSYLQMSNKDLIKNLANKDFIELYRNLYNILTAINLIQWKKQNAQKLATYFDQIRKIILYEMKYRLNQKDKNQEVQRTTGVQKLKMSVPKGNIELLLCLNELIKFSQKLFAFKQCKKSEVQQQILTSSTTSQPISITTLTISLPLIYNFINTIAIKSFKSILQTDVINMLLFLKLMEQTKSAQNKNVLLLQIDTSVYEYLYQSMSVFLMYLSDKGKFYLKLNTYNADLFIVVINDFISKKELFKALKSKKRLVVLQAILVGLIRKKYIKIFSTHLKRSQHAKILLSFMQIFQHPENLTTDLRKIVQQTEFLPNDLQEFSNQTLEKYSDLNLAISRYLEDKNVNLTCSKKLPKLNILQLRREFEEGKFPKIYQMIVKNSKYQLPFELPEPKHGDINTKMAYIIEKIYQKIVKQNNYNIPKVGKSNAQKNKKQKKLQPNQLTFLKQFEQFNNEKQYQIQKSELDDQQQASFVKSFFEVNLNEEKSYIRTQCLINYTYEDHYKMNQSKLPINFKKQNWKNLHGVSKDLQIESFEIDEKIDENIYKQVLLALLGYVEKIKIVAKEFHPHSFIQYVAAQLDLEVSYHGCIVKISRKNKVDENVILVCALQTNYKLLYICTHILRESNENAYIINEKTKETDFKEFLEKLLPQPFEVEESELVDKVVKGEISLDSEDMRMSREDL